MEMELGGFGQATGEFNGPSGIAVNSTGYVYVIDQFNHGSRCLIPQGTMSSNGMPSSVPGQFALPMEIAVNTSGAVYVADGNNNRVKVFDPSGTFLTQWGGQGIGLGQFSGIGGIATDAGGNVYVSDYNDYRIQVFDPLRDVPWRFLRNHGTDRAVTPECSGACGELERVSLCRGLIRFPRRSVRSYRDGGDRVGIEGDRSRPVLAAVRHLGGCQWVCLRGRFLELPGAGVHTPGGYVTQWGTLGSADGQFSTPLGVAVGPDGSVYVPIQQTTGSRSFRSVVIS